MKTEGYTYELNVTAMGKAYRFRGPGMPEHSGGVHPMQVMNEWANECVLKSKAAIGDRYDLTWDEAEADNIARLLDAAFEAGRKAKAAEIREVLGVPRCK